ncbi:MULTISPECIES: hypothetical protein [Protofrankia]|uniref:Uncharacterized protein n=1 Tax=Protofrankia coriariae TaxID=1562887 RepID=A0ABR5F1V3_9ACTN|nr:MULTISPECIES: hypothetical protein [Protofrankia]KLL10623.1 hypothetical protein FrCorBMG51_16660 [Protofrankia coriariae]ONH35104.1 hypothetical protein BL254_12980 [Protofrankia sp. BMG5.30]
MLVQVRHGSPRPVAVLCEPEDFTRLHVELVGVEASAASGALVEAGLGHVAGDVVWLSVEGLRAAVLSALEASSAERTAASFDGMVSYARSRGWVSLDGERLQAHFVYA